MNSILRAFAPSVVAGGVTLAILYYVYTRFSGRREQAESAIGEFIFDVTSETPVESLGGVILPGGERVTFDQIVTAGGYVDSDNVFKWHSRFYKITGRVDDNTYKAIDA